MTLYEMELYIRDSIKKLIHNFVGQRKMQDKNDAKDDPKKQGGNVTNDSDQPESNWEEFKGQENSQDILEGKARILGKMVTQFAYNDTMGLVEKLDEKKSSFNLTMIDLTVIIPVYLEFIFLYMHVIDRSAFQLLKPTERNLFMNSLGLEIYLISSKVPKSLNQQHFVKDHFFNMSNITQNEYQAYELTPPDTGGLSGVLFWEFGKKISKIICGSDDHLRLTMEIQPYIISSVKAFQLEDLFLGT